MARNLRYQISRPWCSIPFVNLLDNFFMLLLQGGSFVWNPPSLSWRRVNVVLQSFVPWLEHYLIYLSVKIDELF